MKSYAAPSINMTMMASLFLRGIWSLRTGATGNINSTASKNRLTL